MNNELRIVFTVFLPALERENFEYWVYGGVALAAVAGEFYRLNSDVDIYVKDSEFQKVKSLLSNIKIDGKKKLSVVGAKLNGEEVDFMIGPKLQKYPAEKMLARVERDIEGFRFFTSSDHFIKTMFIDYLTLREGRSRNGSTIDKIRCDARKILNDDEYKQHIEENPLWAKS